MKNKPKYARADAIAVAQEIVSAIRPYCVPDFLKVAGSLRRGKQFVGDVELVYVPLGVTVADGLFDVQTILPIKGVIEALLRRGVLEKRLNSNGSEMWGEKNKLGRHVASGIPIDLFLTTKADFWNYLVCRTGGEKTNIRIATAARRQGLKWNPCGGGFTDLRTHEKILCASEEEVFAVAGLSYLPPNLRA